MFFFIRRNIDKNNIFIELVRKEERLIFIMKKEEEEGKGSLLLERIRLLLIISLINLFISFVCVLFLFEYVF